MTSLSATHELEPTDAAPRVQRIFVQERGYPKQRRAARGAVVDILANAALRWLCRDHGGELRIASVVR